MEPDGGRNRPEWLCRELDRFGGDDGAVFGPCDHFGRPVAFQLMLGRDAGDEEAGVDRLGDVNERQRRRGVVLKVELERCHLRGEDVAVDLEDPGLLPDLPGVRAVDLKWSTDALAVGADAAAAGAVEDRAEAAGPRRRDP